METFSPDTSRCHRDLAPARDTCSQARHASSPVQNTTYNETTKSLRTVRVMREGGGGGVTDRWLDSGVIGGGGGAFSGVVVSLVVWWWCL